MRYDISGASLPMVEITLEKGETIKCENGAMSWMSDDIKMNTSMGGIGKAITRAMGGEKVFLNEFTAEKGGAQISFTSCFPGNIIAVEVGRGREIVCEKSSFLCGTEGINTSVFFQKKLGNLFFGGEGIIMQKISGTGMVFLEINGSAHEKMLAKGEKLIISTGHLAMMDASCSMDVKLVKGAKNMLFGGEGLFQTVVTGPGRVVLQSMNAAKMAEALIPYMPVQSAETK